MQLWFSLGNDSLSCLDLSDHTHTHTQRNGPGCQRCQWGLQMREDHHTLHSSNGQADGRLLCSLCLGWWLYSSGCYALPAAQHRATIYGVLFLPHTSLCYSLPLLFICTFFSPPPSLHLFFYSLWVCAGVCVLGAINSQFHSSSNFCCWGSELLAQCYKVLLPSFFSPLPSFFLADRTFGHAKTFRWQSCSVAEKVSLDCIKL